MPDPIETTLPREGTPKPEPAKEPEAWKNVDEVKRIIADRDAFKRELRELSEQSKTYKAFYEEHQAKLQESQEKARLTKLAEEGRYQEIIKGKEEKAAKDLAAAHSKFAAKLIPSAIKSAAAAIPNLTKEAIQDLPNLLRDSLAFDSDNMDVKVIDAEGQPMLDDHGKPLDPQAFISGFVQSRPYLLVDGMPKSHGAGKALNGQPGKGGSEDMMKLLNDPKAMREWQERDPEGYQKAYAESFTAAGLKKMALDRVKRK